MEKTFLKFSKSKLYFKYIHDNMGSNYRMTEMQAQLGINQLKQLETISKKRFKIFRTLNNKINKTKLLEDINVPKIILYLHIEFICKIKKLGISY